MPSRHSAIPNLDLSSFSLQTNLKISSPLSPGGQSSEGPSPLTPRSPKSSSSSPFFKGTTIRPVTQDSNTKSTSPTIPRSPSSYTAEPPATPGVTAIPQYPPSPKDTPRHNREQSRSFFGNLKAPKSSHRAQRSDSSNTSSDKPKSRGSSTDRRTAISSKQSESSPDLLGAVAQQEESRFSCSRSERSRRLTSFIGRHGQFRRKKLAIGYQEGRLDYRTGREEEQTSFCEPLVTFPFDQTGRLVRQSTC